MAEIAHGTGSRYTYHRCRCDAGVAAKLLRVSLGLQPRMSAADVPPARSSAPGEALLDLAEVTVVALGQAPTVRTNSAIAAAVSRLMSGHITGKISVPWIVPITWRQRASTPARSSSR